MSALDLVIAAQLLFGLGFPVVGAILLRSLLRRRSFKGRSWGKIALLAPPAASVRFTTDDGEEVTTRCEIGPERERAPLRPGTAVRVRYDPADPQRAIIDRDLSWGLLQGRLRMRGGSGSSRSSTSGRRTPS